MCKIKAFKNCLNLITFGDKNGIAQQQLLASVSF